MKTLRITLLLASFALSALLPGCSGSNSVKQEKTKTCFNCNGTGKVPCPNGKEGLMECPGPCLKLSKGAWIQMDVAGHPPTDLWQKFSKADGGWSAWNQGHVGDVIEYQHGDPVDIGKCKICGGTGKVKCTLCEGTGEVNCPICDGKKVVPESWTTFDNPKMKNRAEHFKLKDGRTIFGKKMIVLGDSITLRTETTNIVIKQSDIVSEEKPVETEVKK